ncbi:hypothetical protein [Arthrobacter sp. KK5.5]|uniref:hypothetical protein n=1 Tax=Arthrobacter sp. KK5.5 TaxID=3373084 RepID=UPI003EE71536
MEHLEAWGGRELTHAELEASAHRLLEGREGNAGWWAQGVAVAYEQEIARREPGRCCNGDFQVGVSKTYPRTLDEANAAWRSLVDGLTEFGGVPMVRPPTPSSTEKWRYWRVPLADGSRVSLDIRAIGNGKSRLGINHTKLDSSVAVAHWRAVWKELLQRL